MILKDGNWFIDDMPPFSDVGLNKTKDKLFSDYPKALVNDLRIMFLDDKTPVLAYKRVQYVISEAYK